MARVKDQLAASKMTLLSKERRWTRLMTLFGIDKLSELFPANAVPNNAGEDHLKCSGDVLRDLAMIGEVLAKRGLDKEQMRERVKNSFTADVQVRHHDVIGLLHRVKGHTFQATTVQTASPNTMPANVHEGSSSGEGIPSTMTENIVVNTTYKTLTAVGHVDIPAIGAPAISEQPDVLQEHRTDVLSSSPEESVFLSIEGTGQNTQGNHNTETSATSGSIFDSPGVDGPRKAKARASNGISEVTAMERADDGQDGGDEAHESEHEFDDVIPARASKMSKISARQMSSLAPMGADGFADLYAHGVAIRPQTSGKRKSAPAALQSGSYKRQRLSYTPRRENLLETERDILASCLRVSLALFVAIDKSLDDEDIDSAGEQIDITRDMMQQVLKAYGHMS